MNYVENVNAKITAVASYIYFLGTAKTESGAVNIYFDEIIDECFGGLNGIDIDTNFLIDHYDEIVDELEDHPGVSDVEKGEDYFNVNFYLYYCGLELED